MEALLGCPVDLIEREAIEASPEVHSPAPHSQ